MMIYLKRTSTPCKEKKRYQTSNYLLALSRAAGLGTSAVLTALSTALVMASPTGVIVPGEGAGVVDRVGGADRLCCMWARTR